MRRVGLAGLIALLIGGCSRDKTSAVVAGQRYDLGRPATPAEVAALDVDVAPDGGGLPQGAGSVSLGAVIYARQCASCHGAKGEGVAPLYPALIGRDPPAENFVFGSTPGLTRTIGNYWPYATSLFDYIRRAMPLNAPGSLNDDAVYAVTAYLLAGNQIIRPTASLDSASLSRIKMPYADKFVRDDRRGSKVVK